MLNPTTTKIIEDNPIGSGLDAFRALVISTCRRRGISPDAIAQLGQKDLRHLSLNLLAELQNLPAASLIPSQAGRGTLEADLLRLLSAVTTKYFEFDQIRPLIRATIDENSNDALIWDLVSAAAVQSTPPPRATTSLIQQTPWSQNTSGIINSSEYRRDVDRILKFELGSLYVGIPCFYEAFFGGIPNLKTTSEVVFQKCQEGENPLFDNEGWTGWPNGAKECDVLAWFNGLIPKLEAAASDHIPSRRKLLAQPRKPLQGSTGKRSMDIGFVDSDITHELEQKSRYHWLHILVAGELKSNPAADIPSLAQIDLATYVREVLTAQVARRFVLGFTLCGSLMRLWEFDRLGGIGSNQFDINTKDGGLQFVGTILGFLQMDKVKLGFDPTIITSSHGERYIKINRHGQTERLIIDEDIKRASCIAGRATTCWRAHHEEDPQTPLVIKDSWQYIDREEEGEMLQEATRKGVVNVARYYHHETIRVNGADDDIQSNLRNGLDVTKATNYRTRRLALATDASASGASRKLQSDSRGTKRTHSEADATLPPSKRASSSSKADIDTLPNRVHRRVILRDYGKPIFTASSRKALLSALEMCIEGHRSLLQAGFLHRDISINNLLINEDNENPSQEAFLVDLDLAIREARKEASGAKGKTGTRAFMAIGALLGDQHSFMHDLESFFWVLFWICIHYNGPDDSRIVQRFEKWNYVDTEELAELKKGLVSTEQDFIKATQEYFTQHYRPLIPWVNRLRKVVFPSGRRWEKEDDGLYLQMQDILREARNDMAIIRSRD
ncbi:hypothetical protein ED733_005849 [Metarhizium rileyi]|uniref:non-specific serine/threonine protein kinase n=1 Tax=Metarhizium rileyi (strain RCEF 4871) TaxID=1649241 RepID=A0A5C6GG15_METRR|nr:hypothetical protein ED733_005849 [Metarhizium rileyi]